MADQHHESAPVAELEYMPSAFELALIKYKKQIILVSILAAVGVASYYTLKLVKQTRNTTGGLAFFRAETAEDYERVAKEQSGKNSGGNALLMAAQLLAEDGKPEKALPLLESFLKDYPEHPLKDLANFRQAEALLAKGSKEEAKAKYQELADKFSTSPHAPLALLRLADTLASEKKTEEARKAYDQVKTRYPGNLYWEQAKARQEMLDRKEPVIVDYVPEPPPAAPIPGTPGAPGSPVPVEIKAPSLTLDGQPAADGTTTLEIPKIEIPTPGAPNPGTPAPAPDAAPKSPAPATPVAPTPGTAAPAAPKKVDSTPAAPPAAPAAAPKPAAPTTPAAPAAPAAPAKP